MRSKLFGLAMGLALAVGGSAFAEDAPPVDAPCRTIAAACKAAGYTHHSQEKNLRRDCMKPILTGQAVAGVTVDPAEVSACKAKFAEHRRPQ